MQIPLPQDIGQLNMQTMEMGQGRTDFLPGDYLATIVDCTTKQNQKPDSQTGQPVFRLTPKLRVEMGPGPGATQFNGKFLYGSYNISKEGWPYILNLFTAAFAQQNVTKEQAETTARNYLAQCMAVGQLNVDPLMGRQIVVSVTLKDNYPNVGKERGPSEWGTSSIGAPTPSAARAPTGPALMQPMPMQQPYQPAQQQQPYQPAQQQQQPYQPAQQQQPYQPAQQPYQPAQQPYQPAQQPYQPAQQPYQPAQQGMMPVPQPQQLPQVVNAPQQFQTPGQLVAPPPPSGVVPGNTR